MAMLTFPKIIERQPQPYLAIRRIVQRPFGDAVDATLPRLWQWIGAHGVEPVGPPFFKYNLIDMEADMEIEFGVPTDTVLDADAEVVTGTLPGGRYASLTYRGHYDQLMEVTAMLKAWDRHPRPSVGYGADPERRALLVTSRNLPNRSSRTAQPR